MDSLPVAAIFAIHATRSEVRSALPDAPVVSGRARRAPVTDRPRLALAHGLERLAGAVAPRRGTCSPAA